MQLNVTTGNEPSYTPVGLMNQQVLLGSPKSEYDQITNPRYTTVEFTPAEGELPMAPLEFVGWPMMHKETKTVSLFYGSNYANLSSQDHTHWKPYTPAGFHYLVQEKFDLSNIADANKLEKIAEQVDITLQAQITLFIHWYNKSAKAGIAGQINNAV